MRFNVPYLKPAAAASVATILLAVYLSAGNSHRTWAAAEVPISFWAWKSVTPDDEDIAGVRKLSGMKALFQRAGQFDLKNGEVVRIRPANGQPQNTVEVHLVYNGTRELLRNLESIEPEKLASVIAETYRSDVEKYGSNDRRVVGVQLDLDFPTRLLPQYALAVRELRKILPEGTQLSITGLPTWMSSKDVLPLLDEVDFWIPQLYGSEIPTSLSNPVPISSVRVVRRSVIEARRIGKPFFAGLAAYGYAILYDKNGELVELRGDIDLSSAFGHGSLEAIRQENLGSDVRHVFRAKSDLVLDGLVIAKGENLVFDMPSPTSLREAARAVREEAGDALLGICIFRLPFAKDKTNLRLREIVDAVRDSPVTSNIQISIEQISDQQISIAAMNNGSVSSLVQDALTIDIPVPPGSVRGVTSIDGFSGFETLCARSAETPQKCSSTRANVIRLTKNSWRPGDEASIQLKANWQPNSDLAAYVMTLSENGRVERTNQQIVNHRRTRQ